MRPAISQVCSLSAPFETDVEEYAAAACPLIELWLPKLETYLETHTLDDVRKLRDEKEVSFVAASYQGGLLATQGEARGASWTHFRKRLKLCKELGVPVIVVAADLRQPLTEQDTERVQTSLVEAAHVAAEAGVKLAVEFQSGNSFMNNLQTTALLLHEIAEPNLGVCLDLFHLWTGPTKLEDLGYLTNENLFHVQMCDLSGVLREFAADADRILPGDGELPVEPVVDYLRRIEYQGVVSLEMMNPMIWQIPPRSTAEIGITALRKCLGQAAMN